VFDDEQYRIVLDGERTISFIIGCDESLTRVECNPTNEGVPFDYYIDPTTVRAMLLNLDNTPIGEISRLQIWPTNQEQTQFKITGVLPKNLEINLQDPRCKLIVIANTIPETIENEKTHYNYTQLDPRNEGSSIPMWGVMTTDISPLLNATYYELTDNVWLLRSAAKIEVKLSDELKKRDTEITSATLKYYNVEGNVVPANWQTCNNTQELNCEVGINVYRHAAVTLPLIKDEESGDYYVYIPEYDNINYPGERNKISLSFYDQGKEKIFEDAISFCEYSNGKRIEGTDYNITRNHIYRFTVRSIAGESIMLEYHVADWDAEDWGTNEDYLEHDISYPTYLNPLVPYDYLVSEDKENYVITESAEMYFGGQDNLEAGAFVAYFKILSPSDDLNAVQWKPGFMASKENYRIRVYHIEDGLTITKLAFDSGGDNDLQKLLPACETNDWYKIVIFPLSADGAEIDTIDLGLSYYQKWTDQYINLFINGEYGNIRWPNSGTNPKIIEIKHVAQPQPIN
jgi:hypothetical protein